MGYHELGSDGDTGEFVSFLKKEIKNGVESLSQSLVSKESEALVVFSGKTPG